MARPVDLAPAGPLALPDTGIGRGWEPAALFLLCVALLSFGLVTLYSASSVLAQRGGLPDTYFVLRQSVGAAIGMGALAVCAWLPYTTWRHLAWPMIVGTWVLLIILILPWTESIAPEINGARRWVRLAGTNFQPSELAKITIIIWTAALAVRKQRSFQSLRRGLGPFLIVWAAIVVPIALEPDLSTALLIGLLGATVVFAAGGRVTHFLLFGLLALPVVWRQLTVSFRADRIAAFLDPSADLAGSGYQVQQSLIAIGSGGITGVGFGEGRQKFGFLPEAHNDFIFAMIGEEWGLIGVTATVLLYMGIVLVGFRVARRAPDLFGQLLAIGLTSWIGLQAVLHMAVGLGLVPTTGLALPLISYGRSTLLVTLVAIGILMSVARGGEAPPMLQGRVARA
jgi:cell division protein FtsW